MRIVYVDTSALGRVLLSEPDGKAIQLALEKFDEVVSSRLLWNELGRLARHRDSELAAGGSSSEFLVLAEELLRGIAAIPVEDGALNGDDILGKAGAVSPFSVATLDAIHLATAVWLAEDLPLETVMTYDEQLAAGARDHGFAVLAPR